MYRRLLTLGFPALFTWISLSGGVPARADEWTKKYSVAGKPAVRVATNDGHVRIETRDGREIEARVETVGWRISNNGVRVFERQIGDSIELDVRVPSMTWDFGVNRSLRIELRIPREANLSVRTGDGHVSVAPLAGSLDIRTGDGHITLTGVKGEMRLATNDGHISASGLDGQLNASTGDGHIKVEGRFERLDLRTGDGHIHASVLAGSKMTASWMVRTGDGRVVLRLPEGFAADLDAHTGDGRISVGFPVTMSGSLRQSTVRGKINGGGATLTVRTGDGSIHIARL